MLVDFFVVAIWVMLPIFWHYMMWIAGLSLFKVTIPSFIIVAMYVYQYIGFPFLYFQLDEYRALFVTDKYLMISVLFYTSITLTLMIAGFIAARQHFGILIWNKSSCGVDSSLSVGLVGQSGYQKRYSVFNLNIGLVLLVVISAIVLAGYLSKIGIENVAIFVVMDLTQNDLTADSARSTMGNAFDGKYHWYKLFMNDLLVLSLLVLFAQYLTKRSHKTAIFFAVVFMISSLVMLMAIEKGPMAHLLISIFLVYVVVKLDGRIPMKHVLYMALMLVSLLTVLYMLFMGAGDVFRGVSNALSRAFMGEMQPAYHYLDYFNNHHELLLGRSFPNPAGIFPFEHFYLTKELMAWHNPGQAEIGVVGSMPAVFWGELYANFGSIGVLVVPFFLGYGLYCLNSIIFRLDFNPVSIGLFVWVLMHLKTLAGTGLSNFMLDFYLFMVLFASLILMLLYGRGTINFFSAPSRSKIYR